MMRWDEFARVAPELARLGEERLDKPGVVLVGTIRRDGSPRISPVEPGIVDGQLLLGMEWRTTKARDLLRDPRILVHNIISDRHGTGGEFKLRGRATDLQDAALRHRFEDYVEAKIGFRPAGSYHMFAVDIESAAFVVIENEQRRITKWDARGGG